LVNGATGKTFLEETRLDLGLDVSALAAKAGVSRDIIWRMEQPEKYTRRPYPATAQKVAVALGKTVSDLFAQVST
jgi:transcriptional regulator with XRE-family HTH domain